MAWTCLEGKNRMMEDFVTVWRQIERMPILSGKSSLEFMQEKEGIWLVVIEKKMVDSWLPNC